MKTMRLDPSERARAAEVTSEIERLLGEGKHITVTVAEEQEVLSPQQAAERLGFSRQHVMRLIGCGELNGEQMAGSSYWRVPYASILAFEQRRAASMQQADDWSRELDAMGAPAE
jgi:excisionase family DNA binding protein